MLDEQHNSQLQDFSQNRQYIRRFTQNQSSNALKITQTSIWNLPIYIKQQINKVGSAANQKELQDQKLFQFTCLQIMMRTTEKKIPFATLWQSLQIILGQQVAKKNINFWHAEKSYNSICRIFLTQLLFFMLSLLSSIQLTELNNQIRAKKCFLEIDFIKNEKNQQISFVLSLKSPQKMQQKNSTLGSQEKQSEQDNKYDQKQEEANSVIQPLQSQNEKQVEQENLFMNYLKQYVPKDKFTILFSNKQHFYLLHRSSKLGQGGFGSVFKSQLLKLRKGQYLHSLWAIKELKRGVIAYQNKSHKISQDRQHLMLTKIPLLSEFKKRAYNNIVEVHEVITFDGKKYIVYEYCPQRDLNTFIKTQERLTKRHIFLIIYQLAQTLAIMHYKAVSKKQDFQILNQVTKDQEIIEDDHQHFQRGYDQNQQVGIIHRDLKLNNILVSQFSQSNIRIKIIDWAFSKKTLTQQAINRIYCGTANYQAPQLLKRHNYCCKVDVWAFGVIAYELLAGKPFIQKEQKISVRDDQSFTRKRLSKMQFRSNKNFAQEEIEYWKQLVRRCMQYKAQDRFTSKQAYEYLTKCPFFKPFDLESIKFLENLKMMKATYFKHHYQLLSIRPLTYIDSKLIKSMVEIFQSAVHVVYQKFTSDKYWTEKTPQANWQVIRAKFKRYKPQQKIKLCLQNCLKLMQNRFFELYQNKEELLRLILSMQQIYQSITNKHVSQ